MKISTVQFIEALGLKYSDYNGAKILLKLLAKKGLVKEAGKVSYAGTGRPVTLYEIPKKIVLEVASRRRIPEDSFMKAVRRAEGLGWCQSDVARELGVSPCTVSARLKRLREGGRQVPDISIRSGWVR